MEPDACGPPAFGDGPQASGSIAKVANLIAGDTREVTISGAQTSIGTHTATATELDNANYCLPVDATTPFVIKLADVTIPSEVIIGEGAPGVTSSNLGEVAQLLVSNEERGLAAEGVDVRIKLEVNRISEEDLNPEERIALAARVKELGATVGQYLDMRVYKQVGDKLTRIEKTVKPLQLSVTVPDELRSSGRTHYLIRGHGDATAVLATTQGDSLEGQSDLFSPYLLAHIDGSAPSPKPSPSPSSKSSTVVPNTGDSSSGLVGLVIVSLAVLAFGFTLRRTPRTKSTM